MSDPGSTGSGFGDQVAASWWTRGKAAIIDGLLFFGVLLIPIVPVIVAAYDEDTDNFSFTGGIVSAVGIVSSVGVVVWGGWLFGYRQGVTGSTPGKRKLHIRMVDAGTDEPPGGARGVGRWLVPLLVNQFAGVFLIVDYLWPLWDSENQRLIDKVFKTRVLVGSPAGVDTGPPLPESPIIS